MYKEMIDLAASLRPTKWYSLITKTRNYRLIYDTIRKVRKEIVDKMNSIEDRYDMTLEFVQCVKAMNSIVSSNGIGINICNTTEDNYNTNYWGCSNVIDIMTINIHDKHNLFNINLKINKAENNVEVNYNVNLDGSCKARKDVFSYGKYYDERFHKWRYTSTAVGAIDCWILDQIRDSMIYYLEYVTERLVTLYT